MIQWRKRIWGRWWPSHNFLRWKKKKKRLCDGLIKAFSDWNEQRKWKTGKQKRHTFSLKYIIGFAEVLIGKFVGSSIFSFANTYANCVSLSLSFLIQFKTIIWNVWFYKNVDIVSSFHFPNRNTPGTLSSLFLCVKFIFLM